MQNAWCNNASKPLDHAAREAALARQAQLTKPPGSLGRLEELAVAMAAMQGNERPRIGRPSIVLFAGDHGVVAEGVSAFPQVVTQQMLLNFAAGGAAIAVLAREQGARLELVDVGSLAPAPLAGVVWDKVGQGSANFTQTAAMDATQFEHALSAGRRAVERALAAGTDLFIAGEMGIGNTTAAAALSCALLNLSGSELAGPGTGIDSAGIARKAAVIDRALALHRASSGGAMEALRCLSGYELAAMAGAFIACAQAGLPVLVDGFIATASALAAVRISPSVRDWLLFGHASAEPGHQKLLAALDAQPMLQLGMRLGEGSGAAMALPVLRLALALHNGMATFAEAGVAAGEGG